MTNSRIKIFLIFLVVLALISVFSFVDVFRGVRSALLHDAIKDIPEDVINDVDNDGLSDPDEAYWNTDMQNPDTDGDGFLDGEEVASGKDPREPAGDDDLNDTVYGTVKPVTLETNITDEAMQLLAGAIGSGDIGRESDPKTEEEALNYLTLSVFENFYQVQDIIAPPSSIKVVAESKENQISYLDSIAEIIKKDLLGFSQRLDSASNLMQQAPYFSAKSTQFKSSLEKISTLDVPQNWVETHKGVLNALTRLEANYGYISNFDKDALKASLAFNEIVNINSEIKNILRSVELQIDSEQLKPSDTFYQVLSILYRQD